MEWVSEWESTGNWFQLINKTWSIYRRCREKEWVESKIEWMEHVLYLWDDAVHLSFFHVGNK